MFAVLQIRPQENGFLQKIKERMHPARPQAIQVAVKGGTPFLCVEASRRKGELPWEEIRSEERRVGKECRSRRSPNH